LGTAVKNGYLKGKDRVIEIPNGNDSPEKEMMEKEQKRIKRKALRKISEKLKGEEKLLLKMRFPSENEIDPISVRDISETFGISEKAVYKRIKKALQKCRLILNEAGISVEDIFGEKK
jgi:RNA polymerase sigma factor (sigma-70 family)